MNTFIAYDIDTFQILAFIKNDYTTFEQVGEVFQNFENYDVRQTDLEIPEFFSNYKVVIENDEIVGFEEIIQEGD